MADAGPILDHSGQLTRLQYISYIADNTVYLLSFGWSLSHHIRIMGPNIGRQDSDIPFVTPDTCHHVSLLAFHTLSSLQHRGVSDCMGNASHVRLKGPAEVGLVTEK